MVTKTGLFSLAAGFIMGLFAGISGFMGAQNFWVDLTIFKLLGEEKTEAIITSTSIISIQDALDTFMYEIPVFGLFLCAGVVLIVIGLFVKEH